MFSSTCSAKILAATCLSQPQASTARLSSPLTARSHILTPASTLSSSIARNAHSLTALPASKFFGNTARTASAAPRSRRATPVTASFRGNGGSPEIVDRAVGSLPYLLPLFDSLRYGKFLFLQYPAFAAILAPFDPLIKIYFSFPFAGLIAFFAVYLGIINSPNFSRWVRFNAMQAVLLDIILILPGLLESVLNIRPMGGPGLQLYITGYNTIFLFVFACVAYGIGSCILGKSARLPLVADAADAQIR